MKTFIKTIRTITAVLMILAGLTVLFILDNANDLITLLTLAVIMVTGVVGGIVILVTTYPSLLDLSEFDDKSLNSLEECKQKLDLLRKENILLIDRYLTFKCLLQGSGYITKEDKIKHPSLYYSVYEEDLAEKITEFKEEDDDELDRFKEIYN